MERAIERPTKRRRIRRTVVVEERSVVVHDGALERVETVMEEGHVEMAELRRGMWR